MVGRRKKIPLLSHQVKLEGAKYPHNVFTIDLPAEGMTLYQFKLHDIAIGSCILFTSPDPNSQPAEIFGDLSAAGIIYQTNLQSDSVYMTLTMIILI